jgi:hypothetical protein
MGSGIEHHDPDVNNNVGIAIQNRIKERAESGNTPTEASYLAIQNVQQRGED